MEIPMTEFDLGELDHPLQDFNNAQLVKVSGDDNYKLNAYLGAAGWPSPDHRTVWRGSPYSAALAAERDWHALVGAAKKLLT